MVSNRCKLAVIDELKKLGLHFIVVDLSEVEIMENITFEKREMLKKGLLESGLSNKPDIIILDFHLDGIVKNAMDGIQTSDKNKEINSETPVIMLSEQDKIYVAVSCMHHKAYDYVVKSETTFVRLQKAIITVFKYQKIEKELKWYMDRM
jgi:two-component system OmpR family response regulator